MTSANEDISRVARAMLAEYTQLLDAIADRVWQNVSGYSPASLEQADLRARIGESVTNVITCLIEGRGPNAAELERSSRNGQRRALQGVTPTAVMQSYRIAERVLGGEFQGWCSRMQVRVASARSGRAALIDHLDQLEHAMLSTYAETQAQIEAEQRLSEPALFRRLASGENIEPADIERLARAVGIDDPERTSFLTIAVDFGVDADRTGIEQYRHRLAAWMDQTRNTVTLSGAVEQADGAVVLFAVPCDGLPDTFVYDMDAALRSICTAPARAAIGNPVHGLAALGTSCRQALDALAATAPEGDAARTAVALYSDSLLEVLVHSSPAIARQLSQHYLAPLDDQADLLHTARVYLSHELSLAQTAQDLGVHKNTVAYRLHKFTAMTGLDLRRPHDIARAVLALESLRLDARGRG